MVVVMVAEAGWSGGGGIGVDATGWWWYHGGRREG